MSFSAELPTVNLPVFEGPLDLLLHLVREHRLEISDIPITLVTDQYLAYLNAMEERDLTLAGEFFVMAATLLEIKSRMLLPKPPKDLDPDDEFVDPREELAQRLLDYERFKSLVPLFQELEEERGRLFFRGQADYGDLYEMPTAFGSARPDALLKALMRLLADVGAGEEEITSVRRQKLTLRLAMHALLARTRENGVGGLLFEDALTGGQPLTRLDIVMLFLALLELMRQGRLTVEQDGPLTPIRIYPAKETSWREESD